MPLRSLHSLSRTRQVGMSDSSYLYGMSPIDWEKYTRDNMVEIRRLIANAISMSKLKGIGFAFTGLT
jgi:hypothetical protein